MQLLLLWNGGGACVKLPRGDTTDVEYRVKTNLLFSKSKAAASPPHHLSVDEQLQKGHDPAAPASRVLCDVVKFRPLPRCRVLYMSFARALLPPAVAPRSQPALYHAL